MLKLIGYRVQLNSTRGLATFGNTIDYSLDLDFYNTRTCRCSVIGIELIVYVYKLVSKVGDATSSFTTIRRRPGSIPGISCPLVATVIINKNDPKEIEG